MHFLSTTAYLVALLNSATAIALPSTNVDDRGVMAKSNELIRSISVPFNTTSGYAARLDLQLDEPVSARTVEEQLSPIKKRGDFPIGLEKRLGLQFISCEGSRESYITPTH